MDYTDAKKRILAARTLLLEPSTTGEKLGSIRTLLEGVHPKIDALLARGMNEFLTVEKMISGHVIQLAAEHLPENTEEEKKRKKALLLFINTWNQLKSEIARVEQELDAAKDAKTAKEKRSHWGRIIDFAKGPFGIITIAAVVIATVLQATSVRITVQNQGCPTIPSPSTLSIKLPGFSLPKDPIADGGSVVVRIPPIPVQVDGTIPRTVNLSALNFSYSYELSGTMQDITLDDVSLLGAKTDIKLSKQKEHSLVFVCTP